MADEKKPRTLRHASDYRERRAAEYPLTGYALDAIAKGFRAYQRGEPLPADTLDWLDERDAVKARFPKTA